MQFRIKTFQAGGFLAAVIVGIMSHIQASAESSKNFWEPVAPLPDGVAGFAYGLVGAKPVVAGGTRWENDTKLYLADVVSYDPLSNVWSKLAPLRRPFAYGVFGQHAGSIYLLGGDDGTAIHADGMILPSAGDKPVPNLPGPRLFSGSTQIGSKLYILGGSVDGNDLSQSLAAFLRIDLESGGIEDLPKFPAGPILFPAMAAAGDDLLVVSGSVWNPASRQVSDTAAAWRYSVVDRRWKKVRSYPFIVRGVSACALSERYVFMAGGYRSPAFTNECFLYDVRDDRYIAMPPLPYAAMVVGLIRDGDSLYVVGGEDRARHRAATVYRTSVNRLLTLVSEANTLDTVGIPNP